MRILTLRHRQDLERELAAVGADEVSWDVFAAKSHVLAIRLFDLSTATANILKQAALSVGADCAVSARVASGRVRTSGGVLFATPRQLERLCLALEQQPVCVARRVPGLRELSRMQATPPAAMTVSGRRFDWSRTYVMGILNVTPDSFSDGGRYLAPEAALAQAQAMEAEGADLIDVGAESTRPGAPAVPAAEQLARVRPVLRLLSRKVGVPVSIDTTSARVASVALAAGAAMVNDVSALADPRMAKTVARAGAACVVMHMQGNPRTMQRNPKYGDLMAEVTDRLAAALAVAECAGAKPEAMIVDPGFGFGKRQEHNYEILRRLGELRSLGRPILVGPSRKRFIGETLGTGTDARVEGTIAACVVAAQNGANIVRVHDVRPVARALRVADRIAGRGRDETSSGDDEH